MLALLVHKVTASVLQLALSLGSFLPCIDDFRLHSALHGHLFKNGLRVRSASKLDLFIIELRTLGRPETHIVKLLVASGPTDRLISRLIVHVLCGRGEAPLGMVNNHVFLEWALIELIDVTSIEVLRYV